jgi:hypothetical protein
MHFPRVRADFSRGHGPRPLVAKGVSEKLWIRIVASNARLDVLRRRRTDRWLVRTTKGCTPS